MIGDVRVVTHGRAATEALAAVVAEAKGDRPLAPVTVVVPSNLVGLTARRLLGAGVVGAGGLANVQFVTPFRLAELLSADLLLDRRPITNPVLGAAVRRALATDPGIFAEVADHHATEEALAALYAELSHLSDDALHALASGPSPMAVQAVRTFRNIAAHLTAFDGEDELAAAATGRPDLDVALAPFGHVVWYLPEPLTPALGRMLAAVVQTASCTTVVGLTGAPDADQPVLDTLARVGAQVPAAQLAALVAPVGSHIVSVTDADEEVRAVVRRVAALAEAGVRLDRIGVFYPSPDPYVTTLCQQFADAGIPANGPSRERLRDSAAGRTLLRALELPAQRWRRDRVMALVAAAPVRHHDRLASPGRWEELSRQAGIVQGIADWRGKAAALQAHIRHKTAELDPIDRAAAIARGERNAAAVGEMAAFVEALATGVTAVDRAAGWNAKAGAAGALLHQVLGAEPRRQHWPEAEQDAAVRVEDALSRLGTLDEIEPAPTTEVFVRALRAELDVTRGRVGRFGEGVVYGPLVSSVGHDLDAVFVLGMAEGQCPAPRRDDALLPDTARALALGELPARTTKMHDQHRALLAALAAAPADRRFLLFPRGDLRSGRHRLPSRWLLTTATALAGTPVYSTDFPSLAEPLVEVVASHAAGVLADGVRASVLDRDLASIGRFVQADGDPIDHPATETVARGLRCVAARASTSFTEWDGNLAGHPVPSPASDQLLSATRLESWATCGFRYFLGSVLGLDDRDDPARIIEISAMDRGTGVHTVLERFLEEVIERGAPAPDTPWSSGDHQRLAEIADAVFAELEEHGRTGRPLHWRLERERLSMLLDDFLHVDDAFRADHGCRPERVELPFGLDGADPVVVRLDDGREISFRGKADRVDRAGDGSVLVTDYKTGKGADYEGIDAGDPVRQGRTLQLGLYSEAAVQLLGAPGAAAHYWMVGEAAGFERRGYPWDSARRARFVEVVTTIVDGIEDGVFAAVPGEYNTWRGTHENCTWCPFDEVCPRERGEFAEAKLDAPQLRVRDALAVTDGGGDQS